MDKLKELLTRCKYGVHLTVNEHRDSYEPLAKALEDLEAMEFPIDPDVRQKMIETDTLIDLQFYPDTPTGFYVVQHYDLDAALDEALAYLKINDAANQEKSYLH